MNASRAQRPVGNETTAGMLARVYAELDSREISALAIETDRTTAESLARTLRERIEDAQDAAWDALYLRAIAHVRHLAACSDVACGYCLAAIASVLDAHEGEVSQ